MNIYLLFITLTSGGYGVSENEANLLRRRGRTSRELLFPFYFVYVIVQKEEIVSSGLFVGGRGLGVTKSRVKCNETG